MTDSLSVPMITGDMSTLDAALAYAKDRLYIGPCGRGSKHPGSVIGDPKTRKGWQRHTSRDIQVITSWFAGTDHGLFIHAGRSDLWIADVDNPAQIHPKLQQAIADLEPPYQATRTDQPGRGHYLFRQPPGRDLGNGLGKLGNGWGEARGRNGVIIVQPSEHGEGGRYQWLRTGPIPVLPDYVADLLPSALDAEEAATDAQVAVFLAEHRGSERPELLDIHIAAWQKKITAGESRHGTVMGHISGAMKEAKAGLIDAKLASDNFEAIFLPAVMQQPIGPKQGKARSLAAARDEWRGILAWAVAQGIASDPDETKARAAREIPPTATEVPEDQFEGLLAPKASANGLGDDAPALRLIRASEVTISRVRYLWDGRIPLGALTLQPGEEGIGKTTIQTWIVARITTGMLPGELYGQPRNVIIIAPEDHREAVVVPRLKEAGADLTRVIFIDARIGVDTDFPVMIPRDLPEIGKVCRAENVALVCVDSLVTTLPDTVKSISYQDMATVLKRLGTLAEDYDIAVAAPWHLNKGGGSDTALRMMDSRAFRTAARAVLLTVADPDKPGEILVALDKANGAPMTAKAARFRIKSAPYTVEETDEETGVARLVSTSCAVAELIGEEDGDGRALARKLLTPAMERDGDAKAWLQKYLTEAGPCLRDQVMEAAEAAGFGEKKIQRAAGSLRVVYRDHTIKRPNSTPLRKVEWRLPDRDFDGQDTEESRSSHTPSTVPTVLTEGLGRRDMSLSSLVSDGEDGQDGQVDVGESVLTVGTDVLTVETGGATGETHSENTSRTREAGSFKTGRSTRSSDVHGEATTNGHSTHSPSGWATCPNCGARFLAVGQDTCRVCSARKLREVRDQTP